MITTRVGLDEALKRQSHHFAVLVVWEKKVDSPQWIAQSAFSRNWPIDAPRTYQLPYSYS